MHINIRTGSILWVRNVWSQGSISIRGSNLGAGNKQREGRKLDLSK